jgi:hypothetical protein
MTATTSAVAGSYYFKVTFGSTISSVATLLIDYSLGAAGPAGGIIFYDKGSYSNGWRYLEAAPSDQSTGIQWYNGSYTTTGTATVIGTGAANTKAIVTVQGAGSYAAKLCAGYTQGGYSDWFLPSQDELNQMYVNLGAKGRGGFASSAFYWSSSELNDSNAWGQYVGAGGQGVNSKGGSNYVRAARAF